MSEQGGGSKSINRRGFLELAGGGTAAFLLWPILSACAPKPPNESQFFTEIQNLPLIDKLKKIDDYFTQVEMNELAARNYIAGYWAQAYLQYSGSTLPIQQIAANTDLIYGVSQRSQPTQEPGGVTLDAVNKKIGPLHFNFAFVQSNKQIEHPVDPKQGRTYGMYYLRSGFTHEIVHLDTQIGESKTLGKVINDNKITHRQLTNPDQVIVNGFNVIEILPDKSTDVFFHDFDEQSTDTISALIARHEGLPVVMVYPRASYLLDFLDWLKYPPERFMDLHRKSDLETLAKDFGIASAKLRGNTLTDDTSALVDGLRTIETFHADDLRILESLYPGITQNVLNKPLKLIR